jgi:hypothetical protein
MNKKYELTQDTISHAGKILHKIKSLRDFGDVKAGDFGGYIEKESNLSHEGDCWVYSNAQVYGNTYISGDSYVYSSHYVAMDGRYVHENHYVIKPKWKTE